MEEVVQGVKKNPSN